MDDLLGHTCFVAAEGPWTGATVQVNCKLMSPVRVGDVLQIVGSVVKRDKKKVFISGELFGEDRKSGNRKVFATMDGISIAGVQLSSQTDAVSTRSWLGDH